MAPLKVVLLGAPGVGKTYLVTHLVQGTFDAENETKEVKDYTHIMEIDSVHHELAVTDTLEGDPKTAEAITNCDGFIVIFNIGRTETFEAAKTILEDIYKISGPEVKIPVVFVANQPDASAEKQVSDSDYGDVAKQYSIPIIECIDPETECVTKIFTQIVQEIKLHPRPPKQVEDKSAKKKGCCIII